MLCFFAELVAFLLDSHMLRGGGKKGLLTKNESNDAAPQAPT